MVISGLGNETSRITSWFSGRCLPAALLHGFPDQIFSQTQQQTPPEIREAVLGLGNTLVLMQVWLGKRNPCTELYSVQSGRENKHGAKEPAIRNQRGIQIPRILVPLTQQLCRSSSCSRYHLPGPSQKPPCTRRTHPPGLFFCSFGFVSSAGASFSMPSGAGAAGCCRAAWGWGWMGCCCTTWCWEMASTGAA